MVVSWGQGINIAPSYGRTTDMNMVLISSLGLAVTMALVESKSCPDQYIPCGSMALGPELGPRKNPRSLESTGHLTATGAVDISIV